MREIARFLGMFVYFCDEKDSTAHFHVRYNEHRAVIAMDELKIIAGALPPRVTDLAVEWAMANAGLIHQGWDAWQKDQTILPRIPPLA